MTSMDDRSEIADYLLDELDELERMRCERRMQEDPRFRADVERLRPLVRQLDGISAEAWDHVEASDRHSARTPTRMRARWRVRPAVRPVLLGFAAAATVAIALVLVLTTGSSSTGSHTVVLSPLAGAPADSRATATITGSDRVRLSVEHLAATDSGHYYELWLMTDTTHLVSVASFRVNSRGSARLSVPLPAAPARYRYLNISLQRAGAGTAISRQSLLRGPAV